MDSILVVSYSFTGTSRRVAQLLAAPHGWALAEIRDAKARKGFTGGMRCVLDSVLRRLPDIVYEGPDPGDFRTVVIVSPVWAWRMAGPMRTFLAQNAPRIQRYAQVVLMNAWGASNAIGEAARIMHRSPVLTAAFLTREIEDGSGTARLLDFGDALVPLKAPP